MTGLRQIAVTDDVVDRIVRARLALYGCSTFEVPATLLETYRREARAMLDAAVSDEATA